MLNVKLLSYTPDAEKVVASSAKLCYSSSGVEDIIERLDDVSTQEFLSKLTSIGHLSPFEHVNFTFAIEGVSRVLTHQLVRHRIASYSQQSQRYVKADLFEYIIPPAIAKNDMAKEIYVEHMEASQHAYDCLVLTLMFRKLSDRKDLLPDYEIHDGETYIGPELLIAAYREAQIGNWEKINKIYKDARKKNPVEFSKIEKSAIEDARYVFPNGCETKIVVTMNARTLMNFFEHRCCSRAQWEIRELADVMLREVYKVAPAIFASSGAPCTHGKCGEGVMSCGVVRKMEDILGGGKI